MKLLHVINSLNPSDGGTCQALRHLISSLNTINVHSEVVCLDPVDSTFLENYPFLIHALGPVKGPWRYTQRLEKWLLAHLMEYDTIIIHGLWLYNGYCTHKVWNQFQKLYQSNKAISQKIPKLYIMPHGMLDPYFQRVGQRRFKAIRNTVYWQLIESQLINESDGLLFTSQRELELAQQSFNPYHPKQSFEVGLGIDDPPVFEARMKKAFLANCPEVGEQPYLLFLSRLHEKKGVDLLLNAYEKAIIQCRRLPKLVIAGPGMNTTYGKKTYQMVQSSAALRQQVYFSGMLSGDAKWGAFYGCEAFILPSHQENFGIAVVEALACQKPVLISDQINIAPKIKKAGAGLVSDVSTEGTLELLRTWTGLNFQQRLSMEKQARSLFEDTFSISPVAWRLKELLYAH
ncbi:glycosyltransferase [Siphonobacter sp. SORGH_AS_1065]|uniref:glycosyltransferase n=1 Tax=Siphonobacter sp. SORGH_AS_1065 TaxID=3041795 RepID=UPI00277F7DF2|nr:glycosyltransferase [Siphonobacter sp. SORGH_AS_1065]MDQ1085609.1 glycosyltransferase involved in cell wall biosynthesis [Siphonobacter sp. SORGH_AS_1065]